jgi:hypothetical protein
VVNYIDPSPLKTHLRGPFSKPSNLQGLNFLEFTNRLDVIRKDGPDTFSFLKSYCNAITSLDKRYAFLDLSLLTAPSGYKSQGSRIRTSVSCLTGPTKATGLEPLDSSKSLPRCS